VRKRLELARVNMFDLFEDHSERSCCILYSEEPGFVYSRSPYLISLKFTKRCIEGLETRLYRRGRLIYSAAFGCY
jgi:hypothetical protein